VAQTIEGKLQNQICEYLDREDYFNATWIRDDNKALSLKHMPNPEFKGIFWRQNVAPTIKKMPNGQTVFRKMPKYALSGIPDIIVIKRMIDIAEIKDEPTEIIWGAFLGIEVKKPGGKQSDWQKAFQNYCPGEYILATSLDDIKAAGL